MKGMYDAADYRSASYRISYFTFMEMWGSFIRVILLAIIYLASFMTNPHALLSGAFYAASVFSVLVCIERFAALNKPKHVHQPIVIKPSAI